MKKIVSSVLAASMVLSLAACGSSASVSESTAASSETSTAATGESAASGSYTGTPIKIGGIGPITGGAAVYGNAVKNAQELAVKEINAANGSDVFEWQFEDDENDAEKSVNAYNNLKDWGMQVLAGPVTTTPSVAVASETVNDNLFMLTPSASSLSVILNDAGDESTARGNVFQICFTDPNQGVASADYIADNGLPTKIGVIYDASDAYSSGIYEKFKAEAEVKGLEIVTAEAFTADNKADLSTQVAKCQEAGAELVFLPIYYQEASQILIAADKIGYAPEFFGCDGMDGILAIEGFDTSLAEGLMLLTPFAADAEDEKTQAFVAAYKEAYGDTPNQFAADAYDVIYAIYQAVLAGGLNGDMDASEICEGLKTQFTSMTFDGLTGTGMTWDATGAISKSPKAVVIKDGAYAAM
ncbi:MAG TPA: ABC transporter substrate-binding protein [Candidatus Gemmiger excrementavium]|uniref:ABC transporter substrate-binding protein n=1 Tax=Candidatus Gemmiger excrementavium TaxID=2838608 RepID=A0A9D2F2R4_9FIRM|nr:ABC transporter substrate-binding protein [Candidatus Gemmiger excrementavium]